MDELEYRVAQAARRLERIQREQYGWTCFAVGWVTGAVAMAVGLFLSSL